MWGGPGVTEVRADRKFFTHLGRKDKVLSTGFNNTLTALN